MEESTSCHVGQSATGGDAVRGSKTDKDFSVDERGDKTGKDSSVE